MSQVLHGTLFRLSTRPQKRTKTVDVIAYPAFNSSKTRDFYEFDGLEVLLKLSVLSFHVEDELVEMFDQLALAIGDRQYHLRRAVSLR